MGQPVELRELTDGDREEVLALRVAPTRESYVRPWGMSQRPASLPQVSTRSFVGASSATRDGLDLALAPALTPSGQVDEPGFFHGFAVSPQVLARGLLVLADVTATRYFQYTPSPLRDPVLTAHGDRLRAECFSACNSVYARLDLLAAGFDGGDIEYGTTNVDIGLSMRRALAAVARDELLHLNIGHRGLTVSTVNRTRVERPVEMPDRWVRALGNTADLHRGLVAAFTVGTAAARRFVASLPAASVGRSGWLSPEPGGLKLSPRPRPGAVHVAGVHRLSAVKRLLPHIRGLTVYGATDSPVAVQFDLPAARLVLGLTTKEWRGHSGEGALLEALAAPAALTDAKLISALLAFEPVIEIPVLARRSGLSEPAVSAALAVLATSGRVGWDLHDQAHFHRELPDDPDRVTMDNPRLTAAHRLVESGAVQAISSGRWRVKGSKGTQYLVLLSDGANRCTCTWYLNHAETRGPCKHMLAALILSREPTS